MGLARGSERLLDADVKLLVAGAEPHASPRAQRLGLGHLLHAKLLAVERARRGFAPRRRRDLYVVDARDHALSVSLRGPARKPSSTSSGSHREPTTGSPSTFSSDSFDPRPAVTKPASASSAGRSRASSASTSVAMPLPPRSTYSTGSAPARTT